MSTAVTLPSVSDTFGALLCGAIVATAVYGITVLQTYLYFIFYPRDGLEMKLFVSSIWVLDTAHTVLIAHAIYYYLISSIAVPQQLEFGVWSFFVSIALNITTAFVVQCFFSIRIHSLSSPKTKRWITPIIGFFVLAHLCFGMETVAELIKKKRFDLFSEVKFEAAVPFAISAILSDVLIAVALCTLLHNRRSTYEDTDNVINKLIVFSINRCILTSVAAVIEVIVFISSPNSLYTFAIDFVIGKLYTNSLLATLNSRQSLRGEGKHQDEFNSREISTNFDMASVMRRSRMADSESRVSADILPSDDISSKYRTSSR